MTISSEDKIIEEARQAYIDREVEKYPKPTNDAEQEYLDLVAWTDKNQFDLFVDGEKVLLEDL